MSEVWMQVLENILKQIQQLEAAKGRDRLDLVQSIRFLLRAMHNSLLGWIRWVDNPNIMTRFTQDELEAMAKKLMALTRAFIEYDLAITKEGAEKGLRPRKTVRKKREELFLV